MKRLRLSLIMALSLALALLLCGCSMGVSVEELFTLPQLPEEYAGLSLALEELLESGYEYVTPESGENIEPIQMVDLDGDGEKSAVVFLRRSGDENPLKILVLDPDGDSYQRLCTIESRGAGVDCVLYRDMTGDGAKELIVGWRGTGEERTATVYRVGRDCIHLVNCDYSRFVTLSYSDSDTPCLITIHSDERKSLSADVYQWRSGVMSRMLRLSLAGTIDDLRRGSLVCGATSDGIPALFITDVNENNQALTQLLVPGRTYEESTGQSGGQVLQLALLYSPAMLPGMPYTYCGLEPQDIDGDGITEIPCASQGQESVTRYYPDGILVDWLKPTRFGIASVSAVTYHCAAAGWYLTLPSQWWDVASVTSAHVATGEERAALTLNGDTVAYLYTITSDTRESRAVMDGRFIITRLSDTIIAGELTDASAAYGVDQELLRNCFSLMVHTWGSRERSNG